MYMSIGNLTTLHPVPILTVISEGEDPAAEFQHAVAELVFAVVVNPKLLRVQHFQLIFFQIYRSKRKISLPNFV